MSAQREAGVDDRAWRFDVRMLEPGDTIEVYEPRGQRWRRGLITHRSGTAAIILADGSALDLEDAFRAGIRRILN